jgi:uncharacterized protein (TIRG00374 family)
LNIRKKIKPIHIIIAAALFYSGFFIISGLLEAIGAIRSFPLWMFFVMLGLASLNYFFRFLKWHYYLTIIEVDIPLKHSILVFLSGFSMTITPAKSGELIKPYILQKFGHEMSHTTPVVFAERFTDLIGMTILVILGSITFGFGLIPILILTGILIFCVFSIQYEPIPLRIITALSRIPRLASQSEKISTLYNSSRLLTTRTPLVITSALSVLSWFFECLCLYVALMGIGYNIPVFDATFIFAFSTLAGIISMLPGGLGATEGVMMVLLTRQEIPLGAATAATLLARAATLWFAVIIGLIAFYYTGRIIPSVVSEPVEK